MKDEAAKAAKRRDGPDESRITVEYEALRALVRNRHMTVEQGLLLLEIPADDRRILLKIF